MSAIYLIKEDPDKEPPGIYVAINQPNDIFYSAPTRRKVISITDEILYSLVTSICQDHNNSLLRIDINSLDALIIHDRLEDLGLLYVLE